MPSFISRTTFSQSINHPQSSGNQVNRVYNLNTSIGYETIQEAIDANETLNGHTIFVETGMYYEHIIVSKSLSLVGENRSTTIIDGNQTTSIIILVKNNNVKITGFTVQNGQSTGISTFSDFSGHNISYNYVTNMHTAMWLTSNNTIVVANTVFNNYWGIFLIASNCTLLGNHMSGNTYNFVVYGSYDSEYDHLVDITNTVDTKPIYYLKNISDTVYGAQTNAGLFVLYKCNNITIKDLALTGNRWGVLLWNSTFCRIENVTASSNTIGIRLFHSDNSTVFGCTTVSNRDAGISVIYSMKNIISGNNVSSNEHTGIFFGNSSDNTVFGNNLANNDKGFWLAENSFPNKFYHNNLINNSRQVDFYDSYPNSWGNDIEGNYWSNYSGVDSDHDGIGDTPYLLDANNTDHFPLMGEFHKYHIWYIERGFTLTLISNSTISNFFVGFWIEHPEYRIIFFDVAGETGYGFCRLCIPKSLMAPPYTVTIDNGQTPVTYYNETLFDNDTHQWIYFAYLHSEHQVEIIPEFPSFLILPLFMIATLLAVIVYKRKHQTRNKKREV